MSIPPRYSMNQSLRPGKPPSSSQPSPSLAQPLSVFILGHYASVVAVESFLDLGKSGHICAISLDIFLVFSRVTEFNTAFTLADFIMLNSFLAGCAILIRKDRLGFVLDDLLVSRWGYDKS